MGARQWNDYHCEPRLGIEIADRFIAAQQEEWNTSREERRASREARKKMIKEYMSVLGWSRSKLYRVAREFGFDSGRGKRKEKI